MRPAHLTFLFAGMALSAFGGTADDAVLKKRQADWVEEVRTRQQPLADELESMVGNDTNLNVFVIDPAVNELGSPSGDWLGKKLFRRHVVKDRLIIEDRVERESLIHSLVGAIRQTDGFAASCFEPIYGVTIERGVKKIDLVVCFMCLQLEAYGAYGGSGALINGDPAPIFSAVLKRHGIVLPSLIPAPNQSTDPTLTSGTPAAVQPARHP
jgi:hypothetical protein